MQKGVIAKRPTAFLTQINDFWASFLVINTSSCKKLCLPHMGQVNSIHIREKIKSMFRCQILFAKVAFIFLVKIKHTKVMYPHVLNFGLSEMCTVILFRPYSTFIYIFINLVPFMWSFLHMLIPKN